MAFYWFGSSWVYGDELEHLVCDRNDRCKSTFAHKVSCHFGHLCINLAECGSSTDAMLHMFLQNVHTITDKDTVFFFTVDDIRISLLDEKNQIRNILPNGFPKKHNTHPHVDQWYRYFDTEPQRSFSFWRNINLMHHVCEVKKINHWFSHMDVVVSPSELDLVDPARWLLPKNRCLADSLLPITGSRLYLDDCAELTEQQWAQQKKAVEQYIKPCWAHPNLAGHDKLAVEIINLLSK